MMNAQLLKALLEAKSHLKKVDTKLNCSIEDDYTDQLVYKAHIKAQDALMSLDRAILRLQEGC